MTKVIIIAPETHMVKNTKSNKFWMEYFRKSYEQFMDIDSTNFEIKGYTLEEQVERYSKNLAYWYIQFETNKPHKSKIKQLQKEQFIKLQIKNLQDLSKNIFPPDVPELVEYNTNQIINENLNTNKQYFIPPEIQNYTNQQLINSNNN